MFLAAIEWVRNHPDDFRIALTRHLEMSAIAMLIALAIGVPVAAAIVRSAKIASIGIAVVNGLRTIPSLAILALTMPLMGIGLAPSVVALTVLALPPILINSFIGLRDADPAAVEAAIGIGMTRRQTTMKVRFPLAYPAIFAGTRTAAVQVLSGATLAPFIGGGGLGDFIATGISAMDPVKLLVGAVPIASLALGSELLFSLVERLAFSRRAS
ncbi:ABC transporter permease [Rhizobium calliandrae]|uniref:ABC transporter permease n=2 Tax=Rhizobium TaxID=379 RepID=A0A387FXX0_9HYPH|nr:MULTISPECIES: ABC transporter permease [Rhizobium]AYG59966.1 ABC transporter permease [Rhizobium jaguaris]MDL2406935.1 ABC transporter permease [Rhizobium calliandrae]